MDGRHDHCCVPLCKSDSRYEKYSEVSFHAIPKDQKRRQEWIHAIRRDPGCNFQITASTKVCSLHFEGKEILRSLCGKRHLIKGAVPHKFPWAKEKTSRKPPRERAAASVSTDDDVPVEYPQESETNEGFICEGPQDHDYTERIDLSLEDQLKAALEHISLLEEENSQLKSLKFGINRFTTDNDMIAFYTGFRSYDMFLATFLALQPTADKLITWSQIQRQRSGAALNTRDVFKHEELSTMDQFFLFMCRCKAGHFEKDLAERFNVSLSTVSRVIITWANYLYHLLGGLPIWPSREKIDRHMPQCFKDSYPSTRVIIDCTEIKCQTPSALYLNSQLYSHYKGNTTFKGLIGITPSGAVSFISQLYTGSISDVEITKRSGITELLDPMDCVMADKGFTIQDLLAEKSANLTIPPFLTGKRSQFERREVQQTQSIARVRIHVERAIRRVKEYHIFDSIIPLSLAGTVNQIWTVCALLTNFRGPLF